LLAGKLGVFGQSYGGAIAIEFAAKDRRVAAVAAVAPFDDPRAVIPEFARGFNPKLASKFSDQTFAAAEKEAARMAGFRWETLSVIDAVKRLHTPVLLFHGALDTWVAPKRTETLLALAPAGSRREVTPHDNHLTLMVRLDLVGPPALAWFDENLVGSPGHGGLGRTPQDNRGSDRGHE